MLDAPAEQFAPEAEAAIVGQSLFTNGSEGVFDEPGGVSLATMAWVNGQQRVAGINVSRHLVISRTDEHSAGVDSHEVEQVVQIVAFGSGQLPSVERGKQDAEDGRNISGRGGPNG